MGRILNMKEMLLVSGGNGESEPDEEEEEDEVITTGVQILSTYSGYGGGGYGGFGDYNGDISGEGSFGDNAGSGDEIIVTAQQTEDAQDALKAIQLLLNLQNTISDAMDIIGVDADGNNITLESKDGALDKMFKELAKVLNQIENAASVAEVAQLIASGQIQEGVGQAISTLMDVGGTALVTSFFAGVGTAIGTAPGAIGGAIGGFLAGVVYSNASETLRDQISSELAEILIDLVVAAIDGAGALSDFVNNLADQATDFVTTNPDNVGGVPQGIPGPNSNPTGPPPSILDGLFDETPPPGYEWQ